MKSENIKRDELKLLLYLEGTLSEAERSRIEQQLADDPEKRAELEQISQVINLSAGRPGMCIPDDKVETIAAAVTRSPGKRVFPRAFYWMAASAAIVTSAVLLAVVPFNSPRQSVSLDWETDELRALSRDMAVAGAMLEESYWFGSWEKGPEVLENTDRSLLELTLQMDRLEASLESQHERTIP